MNTIDARTFDPHALGHAAILGALSVLPKDIVLTVLAPKLPVPLYDEVEEKYPESFDYRLVSQVDGEFRIEFRRK